MRGDSPVSLLPRLPASLITCLCVSFAARRSCHVLGRTTSSAIKILRWPLQSQFVGIYIMPANSDSALPCKLQVALHCAAVLLPAACSDWLGNFTRSAHVCSTTLCNPSASRKAKRTIWETNAKPSLVNTLTLSSFSFGLSLSPYLPWS